MHYLCFQRKISMSANECINAFSSHLFWDIRKEDIDLEQYPKYIIKRVLEYGMWNDWIIIRSYYGLPKIVEEAKKNEGIGTSCFGLCCCNIKYS